MGDAIPPLRDVIKALGAIFKPLDAITKPLRAISKPLADVTKALEAGRLRFIATFLAASGRVAMNRNLRLPLGTVIPPPIIGRRVLGRGSRTRSGARAVRHSYEIVDGTPRA
ncbi:MAG: hypothetical protein ACTHM6_07395 [Tepidisphaeraceae bacterium]